TQIYVVVHSYYTEDTRVRKQCEFLASEGYDVNVICLNRGRESEFEIFNLVKINRKDVSRTPGKLRTTLSYIIEYVRFFFFSLIHLYRVKPDLVIAHNMPNFLVFSALFPKLRGVPVLLDVHDLMPEIWSMMSQSRLIKALLLFEERISHAFATQLITVNHEVATYLSRRNKKKYFVTHNGPLTSKAVRSRSYENYCASRFNLVFHGNIHERYGLQRLVSILPTLKERYQKINLSIYGYGPYLESIEKLIDELNIADYCKVYGRFEPDDVEVILANKGLGFVVADKSAQHDLAIPVKLTEYISHSVPAICTDLTTTKLYFEGCVNFFDVTEKNRLFDTVCNALDHPKDTFSLVSKAKEKLSEISWDNEKSHYKAFLQQVIK
ncbi:glycosyltransferase, partial [Shewanella amazonensis]